MLDLHAILIDLLIWIYLNFFKSDADYQRIMFIWDKYGRFKLLFYK